MVKESQGTPSIQYDFIVMKYILMKIFYIKNKHTWKIKFIENYY